jgi:DNA-binding NtrC family response regulator
VPELRDRPEDVPALAAAALARWNERVEPHRRIGGISDDAVALMQAYDWPGNVRELMTAIEYGCIVCEGGRILSHHLPEEVREGATAGVGTSSNGNGSADARRVADARAPEPAKRYVAPDADAEREAILQALEEADGNRTRAAAALGMGRTTLWQKLKEYGL